MQYDSHGYTGNYRANCFVLYFLILFLNFNDIACSMGRRPLMGGNWKLNPRKVSDAVGLATEVSKYSVKMKYCINCIIRIVHIWHLYCEVTANGVSKNSKIDSNFANRLETNNISSSAVASYKDIKSVEWNDNLS